MVAKRAPENETADLVPLASLGLDEFEIGLVPLLRHFVISLQSPETHSWQYAFKIASERWGDTLGLPVAQGMFELVQALYHGDKDELLVQDPLDPAARLLARREEALILHMIHYMRREETAGARDALWALTKGRSMSNVICKALGFANRFPAAGRGGPVANAVRPVLRVVR